MHAKTTSHYLKNTVPELEDEFTAAIKTIPVFSGLPNHLVHLIFQYSNFVKLPDRHRFIVQGSYDPRIYVLLHGKLNVLIKDGERDIQVDTMRQPFMLLGEMSLLGEPRGASIETDGPVLLLSMDMSFLPDIEAGFETPSLRVSDQFYLQNENMYTILATVLIQRLTHLEHELYELQQELRWNQTHLAPLKKQRILAKILDQLLEDGLPRHSGVPVAFQERLGHLEDHKVRELLDSDTINSKQLHIQLVRLHVLGQLASVNDLLFEIVDDLYNPLHALPEYEALFEVDSFFIPPITAFEDFLKSLYRDIDASGVLARPLKESDFLEAIIRKTISPFHLGQQLLKGEWIKDNFTMAYVMYLFCKNCIHSVADTNKKISHYLPLLSAYHVIRDMQWISEEEQIALAARFSKMQELQDQIRAAS